MGGIESRVRIGKGVPVHVADARQHARPRSKDMGRRSMSRGAFHRIDHVPRVLHDGHERIDRVDPPVAAGRGRDGHQATVFIRAGRAAPGDLDQPILIRYVREAVDVAQVVRIRRRENGPRDDDVAAHDGCDGVEPSGAVRGETEPREVLIPHEQRPIGALHLQLEVPESVERIGAAARRDPAAVLRPRRGVLNVPELAVSRADPRDRDDPSRQQRNCDGDGDGAHGITASRPYRPWRRLYNSPMRRIALLVPQILTYPNDYRASIFVLGSRESQRNGTHDTACMSLPQHILTHKKPDWLTATKGCRTDRFFASLRMTWSG